MKLPFRYNHPMTQVVLVGIVCFLTVGMYGAVGSLGAGGTTSLAVSDTSNGVLYGCFAIMGIFAGSVNNILGPRLTLFLGSLGYALYLGALWSHQVQGTNWFLIFAGAILGITAALLWSAQGAVMMSYPMEQNKGRSFSVFWIIFSLGGFMGGLIAMGIELQAGALSAVATSTYVVFIILIFVGSASAFTILPPARIVREDGTLVKLQSYANPKTELINIWKAAKDWKMVCLIPMFFGSNYFYSYQGAVAFKLFDVETRAINAVTVAVAQITGAAIIGSIYDFLPFPRRIRAFIGLGLVTFLIIVAWACGLAYQTTFNRETDIVYINYKDAAYAKPAAIQFFFYLGDSMFQGTAYWVMGALTNDPFMLARYCGFYKGLQSAGAAVAYGVDAVYTPYMTELISSWVLILISLPLCAYVMNSIEDTLVDKEEEVYAEDVIQQADGTLVEQKGPGHHHALKESEKEKELEATSTAVEV